MFANCPKCNQALERDPQAAICPGCGLVFAKYVAAQERQAAFAASVQQAADQPPWWHSLLAIPEKVEGWQVLLRLALYVIFFIWGWRLWLMDIRDGEMGESFMHPVNLVFHEAGHVLFIPFGEFMHIAGGTLGQWLMPVIACVALHRTNRDNFGASLALWWLSISIMDAAPYAYDAAAPKLILLGGRTGEDGPHDWIDMLGDLGLLRHARGVGYFLHDVGLMVMLLAFLWGGVVLYRQYQHRSR